MKRKTGRAKYFVNLGWSFSIYIGVFVLILWSADWAVAEGGALEKLMAEVGEQHPAMRAQQAMAAAADAGVDGARWQFFPTPSFSMESAAAAAGDPNYQGDNQIFLLGLSQPLWTGGRLFSNMDKAVAGRSKAAAGLGETRLQLSMRVVQTYGDWLTAHEKLAAYRVGYNQHQQLKKMVVRRVSEGQSSQSDLLFAEQRLAALESEISVVEMQEYIALSRLSQLMGRPVVLAELTAAPSPSPRVDEELTELLRRAETVSPVLKRYQAQVEEQDAVIRERKSEMWPEAYARLEWQYGSFSVKGSDPETRVFVGLKSHFGAGLSNRSAISEAVSQRNALVAEIEIQKRTINEQIMTDFATLRSVSQREKALVTARERARVVMDSWDRQFLSGRKSWQDVMNSVRELVQLEVQFSDLSAMRLVSSWRIRLAVEDGVKEKGSHD